MRTTLFAALAGVVVLTSAPTLHAADCDRRCLTGVLDAYFDALAAHQPAQAPFAKTVKFTENVAALKLGEGLWQRAGRASYRVDAVDPVTGQVASNAVIDENGKRAILFVRLRVADKAIIELETLIVRPGEGQRSTPDALTGRSALYDQAVPVSKRASRPQMLAASNGYLDAIGTAGTDAFVPAPLSSDALRIENGVQPRPPTDARPRTSINDQLKRGFGNDRLRVTDRRYPVIDEERGIAVVMGVMNLNTPAPGPGRGPGAGFHAVEHAGEWKQVLVEFFKVSEGVIQEIQATMFDLDDPKLQTPGW